MITEALNPVLTMDGNNYNRDFESSPLGLSVLAFIITGPLKGRENGKEASNLEIDSYKNGLGDGREIQL